MSDQHPYMKTVLLLLLPFFYPFNLLANRIDSLKTNRDVERFVTSIDSTIQKYSLKGNDFQVIPRETLVSFAQSEHLQNLDKIRSWQKLDLNHDGKTDLVIHARWFNSAVFVVMDMGHGLYKLYRLKPHEGSSGGQIAVPVYSGKNVFLVLYGPCCQNQTVGHCTDTVVYHDQAFIEYEAHPVKYAITSVTFTAHGCPMGECLAYKIKVNSDRSARYVASSFIAHQGVYTCILQQQLFGRLMDLLNYIHVGKMHQNFENCGVMDAGQWRLEVLFQNGSKMKYLISADQAPYGLLAVENLFSELRRGQPWDKIK
jgi:hypothetical protein